MHDVFCIGCGKHPEELECYLSVLEPGKSARAYVINNEGTYNPENGHFLCDDCYIKAGMPSAPGGWKAP